MTSYHQVRDSCSTDVRHGCSKAQMCLNKILSIISSIPPKETPKEPSLHLQVCDAGPELNGNSRGFAIDLNLRLGPVVDAQESESQAENGNLSACSFVGKAAESDSAAESQGLLAVLEKSSEGECDPKEKPAQVVADKAPEVSEITNQPVESSEIEEETKQLEEEGRGDDDEEVKTSPSEKERENKSNDYLGLLVEAAKLISGNFGDDEADSREASQEKELSSDLRRAGNESTKTGSKRKKNKKSPTVEDWLGDLEDTSPVVRSKRGRTQVLPTRYRDSVLEPWKPLPRPHKPSTTTTVSRIHPRSRR